MGNSIDKNDVDDIENIADKFSGAEKGLEDDVSCVKQALIYARHAQAANTQARAA